MDSRFRTWLPRISLAAVLALLTLVGVIQYQWFSRSAAVEIETAVRGLEASVWQTVSREFQRFAPAVADLEAYRTGAVHDAAAARATLTRLWNTYGPTGPAPNLVSWVGYQEPGTEVWNRLDAAGWTRVPAPADRSTLGNFARFQADRTSPTLLLGFDPARFSATYVEPVLKEQYPGAVLEWQAGVPDRGPPQGPGFNSRTYAFNPVAALTGGAHEPATVTVPLPPFPEFPFRNARFPDGVLTPGSHGASLGQIRLTLASEGPAAAIEQRLAWNWWGTTLLLMVLGAAFALVLRQSGRVADLRRREREFVASVSHELRTPLTVIRSAADNFSQGIVPAERQGRYGQLILDQALRLGRMVEQMLAFAQAEAGPSAPVRAPLAFAPWLAEIKPALENLAHDRAIRLVWDVAGVPPGGKTDPDALRSILENLVVNALNHAYPGAGPEAEAGSRSVRVTLRFLVPNRLELTVDDDGRGISPKEAKNVFEPFYRDQVSRNTQEKGSGLGLFLARRQARRLGGDLKLESPWRRTDGVRRPGCRFVALVPFEAGEEVPDGR